MGSVYCYNVFHMFKVTKQVVSMFDCQILMEYYLFLLDTT